MQRAQINNYCNNRITRLDIYVLARICTVLDCRIEDVLEFVPAEKITDKSHTYVANGRENPLPFVTYLYSVTLLRAFPAALHIILDALNRPANQEDNPRTP